MNTRSRMMQKFDELAAIDAESLSERTICDVLKRKLEDLGFIVTEDQAGGPTAMLNGISFLFGREEIPPEVIRNVMLYCLDCYSAEGVPGKCGTSRLIMERMFNCEEESLYAFGSVEEREAVLLTNKQTVLTEEKTIEYFI